MKSCSWLSPSSLVLAPFSPKGHLLCCRSSHKTTWHENQMINYAWKFESESRDVGRYPARAGPLAGYLVEGNNSRIWLKLFHKHAGTFGKYNGSERICYLLILRLLYNSSRLFQGSNSSYMIIITCPLRAPFPRK
jgi:hypothetical protein